MKHSLKEIIGYTIETTDGTKGKVKDFLFDEDNWIIRYIEADFGGFFKDKRILIPFIELVSPPLLDSKHISLNITKEEIDACPTPEDKPTISREYEQELMKHYGYAGYWSSAYIHPSHPGLYYPARPVNVPPKEVSEEQLDTRLRSFKEVKGYHIQAIDGKLGHVEDMIADDADWQLIYLIVDTSNWRPWSKKVILLINWLEKISYKSREVFINVHTDVIKNAPEYDDTKPFELSFEEVLLDYYERRFR
jgi:uncharacterized protein YrrD